MSPAKKSSSESNPAYKYFARSQKNGERIHVDPNSDEFINSSNYRKNTFRVQLIPENNIVKTTQEILNVLNTDLKDYPIDIVIMQLPLKILKKYASLENTAQRLDPKWQEIIETFPIDQIRQVLIDTIESLPETTKAKK